MEFFVPFMENATTTEKEAQYADFAQFAGAHPAPMDKRVYKIKFEKKRGEIVEAVVGGHITSTTEQFGKVVDNAYVLAIFEHSPWLIVTSSMVHRSSWANPAFVGAETISNVEYFQPESVTVEA